MGCRRFADLCRFNEGCLCRRAGFDRSSALAGRDCGARLVVVAGVFAAVPCIGPLSGGARVYVDELTFRVVTDATGAE